MVGQHQKKFFMRVIKAGIIGGGLSGSLSVIRLIETFGPNISLVVFEKREKQLNLGVAYSSALLHQLLNVPAGSMSLYPERPGHFLSWLHAQGLEYEAADFVPRNLYGKYVKEQFTKLKQGHSAQVSVTLSEVVNMEEVHGKYNVTCQDGSVFGEFDFVFLCTGNFQPADVPNIGHGLLASEMYVSNPWTGSWMQDTDTRAPVLMVGSGLTMVDQVLSLRKKGHDGKIYVLSRRGLLPQTHHNNGTYKPAEVPDITGLDVIELLRWIRSEVKLAEDTGHTWHSVVDSIRDLIPAIWRNWSLENKQRFLRHLRPYWEIHRHRVPLASFELLQEGIRDGNIILLTGRITRASGNGHLCTVSIQKRGGYAEQVIEVERIVNCTGPQANLKKINSPLYHAMVETGMATHDPLDMGISTDPRGWVLDHRGMTKKKIAVVGPPAKGTHWECTALREIRSQVGHLVDELATRFENQHHITSTALL